MPNPSFTDTSRNSRRDATQKNPQGSSPKSPPQSPPKPPQAASPKAFPEEQLAKKPLALRILLKVLLVLAVTVSLVMAYLFLLVGEPEEDSKYVAPVQEEQIRTPMTPMEGVGESSLSTTLQYFGQPVLYIAQGAELEKSRINDTASGGSYARVVTLSYRLPSGASFEAQSLRPTSAASLLKGKESYSLNGDDLYSLAGMSAARMDSDSQSIIFTKSDTAVYAVIFQKENEEEVTSLLRFTSLKQATEN